MSKKNTFYITSPIYYATAAPHLGHMYTTIICDVVARYHRMLGHEVLFLTGTDEHGSKVYQKAQEARKDTQAFLDEQAAKYELMTDVLDISNDIFMRTSYDWHKKAAQEFWKRSFEHGDIYKKKYTGLYCVGCEAFKTEKDLDEKGLCPDHKQKPERIEEENYFFRLSAYGAKLKKLFKENPEFVIPEGKRKEMHALIEEGLEDVSISRHKSKLSWGVEVPGDSEQVMYVWFDALTNYITAAGYAQDEKKFKKWWPADVHVVGKEINRFHSLLWPAMLISAGVDIPKQIAVHGWITVDGQKMSKTLGNVLDPFEIVKQFPLSAVRYFMLREIPFDSDGVFSFKRLGERYEADLANGLGNLFYRVLSMIEKYTDGCIPQPSDDAVRTYEHVWKEYNEGFRAFRFDRALEAVWALLRSADQVINEEEPWKLADPAAKQEVKLNNLLYTLATICHHAAWFVYPFMPSISEAMFEQLGLNISEEFKHDVKKIALKPGTKIKKGSPLFPRLV
ncbi:MAG TPA: methionine--tRNA ligase [Candidatus Magasanikbacteria bacterium]|nr:methionine--tRNA ligase [Candidatus Magasanikbacteria bacterium]